MFRSLSVRNYRLYFFGQIVSVSGTWMQSVAQAWLVLRIAPGNVAGLALGTVTALQFLPLLLVGAWGGVIADRFDKRTVLFGTQTVAGTLALGLGLLTATGAVRLWTVFLFAGLLGCVNVVDNPTRQSFVQEMVGPDHVANAVSLNSVVMNGARVVGPAVAGGLIATVGIAPCFFVNAGSYLAVIAALALMRKGELGAPAVVRRAKGQVRQGLRYVWRTHELRNPLLMMVVIGTLAYEFQVTLPLVAKHTFHGGPGTYGAMLACMSVGAVVGGLVVASRGRPGHRTLTLAAIGFGVMILAVAAAPTLPVIFVLLPIMGGFSIVFIAMANATLQLRADPSMRGRVMALYAVAFLGSTPIGAPIVGAVAQAFNPRVAVGVGGVAALIAVAAFGHRGARHEEARLPAPEVVPPLDEEVAREAS